MSDKQTEAAVFSGEWAAEKRLVADRLEAMVLASGQSDRPGLSFEEKKTRMGVLPDGEQVSGVMVYHPVEDLVAVDLKRLFEAPGTRDLANAWLVAMVDGFLLHELGHRRDRVAVGVVGYGWAASGAVTVVGCLAKLFVDGPGVWAVTGTVAIPLFLLWCVLFILGRRRLERRADDHMADMGGAEVSNAMLDGVENVYLPGMDRFSLYDTPEVRRQRVKRRLAQRR